MKKIYLAISVIFYSAVSLGAPCGGALGAFHINPDGSTGGFVAKTASVSKSAYVDASSSVCERARVEGNVQLRSGSEAKGSAVLEGSTVMTSSKISGSAKAYGKAVVTNSKICQASDINFNVINSDHYCLGVDDEPADPGELGDKTLLGIDSDVDGVRDDVEIWINKETTNTPQKNMYNQRMALRQIAIQMRISNIQKDNNALVIDSYRKEREGQRCLMAFDTIEIKAQDLLENLMKSFYNTMDRLEAYVTIKGRNSGQTFEAKFNKTVSDCSFTAK
jgi:hypothetical protein